ncbi:MAG: phosphoglycerate kinase [Candidatus Dadabacteria bacterium]|nr:MAG: phosphoglycerate kinase [Candidatus Dadabacteria bacterium]
MKLLSVREIPVEGARVLIRADLNVPVSEEREIEDDHRIKQFLPTLKFVLEKNGKAVVMSHFGRPGGEPNSAFSLDVVGKRLSELLGKEVFFCEEILSKETVERTKALNPGEVILLENLRFYKGETNNDPEFAKALSELGDVYINDAFAVSHRSHASVVGVPAYFSKEKRGIGLLMEKELEYYEKSLIKPKRPLCVILGGKKVSTKLQALLSLSDKADKIIIGGAMANTFLAAQGLQMGTSFYEPQLIPTVLDLIGKIARREKKLYLPVDLIVAPSIKSKGLGRAVPTLEVPADTAAFDIGPATAILYKEAVQNAETIVWNGPMGVFEAEDFAKGTLELTEALAASHALVTAGGGDTVSAINKMKLAHKFDYISTGGGAFLHLLEGKTLPAIEALK